MMQSIPETGNKTLLDWRHSTFEEGRSPVNFISDYFCGFHTFMAYREDRQIVQLKVFSEFVETDLPLLDRQWRKKEVIPHVLDQGSEESKKLNDIKVFNILEKEITSDQKKVLLISNEDQKYQITAYNEKKLVYYNVLETSRIEEVLYYAAAINETFMDESGEIFIESSNQNFEKLNSIFSKYFRSISAIHKSVADICQGLDSSQIVDVNCAVLQYYLAG